MRDIQRARSRLNFINNPRKIRICLSVKIFHFLWISYLIIILITTIQWIILINSHFISELFSFFINNSNRHFFTYLITISTQCLNH